MAATLAIHMHTSPSTAHNRRSRLPLMVAGSVALALGTGGALLPSHSADAHSSGSFPQRAGATPAPRAAAVAPATRATVAAPPAQYTVVTGDTVTGIAARYGLTPASVLAENGLSWGSIIHPGQTLVLGPSSRPFQESPASSTAAGQHTVVSGDTVTAIASRYATSVDAILTANGLSAQSIIYPGQSLTIPATVVAATSVTPLVSPQAAPTPVPAPTSLSDEMAHNAEIIVAVGLELGVSERALVIALATAMQESSLRNLNWGDRDSRGLFQQRPSTGWGTIAQVTDPRHAARLFFGGPRNPNAGKTRGLLDIPGWEKMSVNDAAQAVQLSGHPYAYAKWEKPARAWVAELLR